MAKGKPSANQNRLKLWGSLIPTGGLGLILAALLLALFSALGTRWEWWDFQRGLGLLRDSFFIGMGGLVLSAAGLGLASFIHGPVARALIGLTLGVFFCGYLFATHLAAEHAPPIHDISTDTHDPPVFAAILPLRAAVMNSSVYGFNEKDLPGQQHKAYPDIHPLLLDQPVSKAFNFCLMVVEKSGWAIIRASVPEGRIEATDRTFWFGFNDDVVIRVKPEGQGSRIDVRSVSRVGRGDAGTNAKRIRDFLRQVKEVSQG